MPRLLDLFAGRGGWWPGFLRKGWEVVAYDLTLPSIEIPAGVDYRLQDILTLTPEDVQGFDFICASSPCEQFSVHGMKHFHPNPKYPEMGLKLFNHTRMLCESAGCHYVMENVRSAQQFVGTAVHHCGPFYLWGTGVPPIMAQGIKKGIDVGSSKVTNRMTLEERGFTEHNSFGIRHGAAARRDIGIQQAQLPSHPSYPPALLTTPKGSARSRHD